MDSREKIMELLQAKRREFTLISPFREVKRYEMVAREIKELNRKLNTLLAEDLYK